MNQAKGEYKLNGWHILSSEHYNDWDLFPIGLSDDKHDEFNNNECITFRRLVEATEWVKTEQAEKLKEKYLK
jgi:hypothetical protein